MMVQHSPLQRKPPSLAQQLPEASQPPEQHTPLQSVPLLQQFPLLSQTPPGQHTVLSVQIGPF
jgi:hypothetical protein